MVLSILKWNSKIEKVVLAFDRGKPVDPDNGRAQTAGTIIMKLPQQLWSQLRWSKAK